MLKSSTTITINTRHSIDARNSQCSADIIAEYLAGIKHSITVKQLRGSRGNSYGKHYKIVIESCILECVDVLHFMSVALGYPVIVTYAEIN